MIQLKTLGILSSVLTIAWLCVGCSSSEVPVVPTAPATRLLDRATPSIALSPPGPVEGQPSGQPQTPITTKLLMSHIPLLQETAVLTFTVSATSDVSDITAAIKLPDGATLLSGEATWQGQLEAGQSQTLNAVILFHSEGDWILEAKALSPQANGDVWGDASYIYLHVAEDASHLGFEPDTNFTDIDTPETPPPAVYPAAGDPTATLEAGTVPADTEQLVAPEGETMLISGYVLGGGDTSDPDRMGGPRRFEFKVQTDDGQIVMLTYTAFPSQPNGAGEISEIRLDFHEGTIQDGHYLIAQGTYSAVTNNLSVAEGGDYIETYPRKP